QKSPFDVAAGGFNGDGKPDLATAKADSGDVGVLVGNGDGSFWPPVYFPTGAKSGSQDLDLGDFHGGGTLDPSVTHAKTAIVLGNGDGSFQSPVSYVAGSPCGRVALADLDGDELLDVAATSIGGSSGLFPSVSVFRGMGNGSFQPAEIYVAGFDPKDLAAG